MPPTATYKNIKAYLDKIEKDEIKPHGLPPCPACHSESRFFKVHAYRERRFLIIVEMIVESVYGALVRFKCPGCGKTIAFYPDFALPHKHYTRQSVVGYAQRYVTSGQTTYAKAVEEQDGAVPEYPDGIRSLAPSTVHRWVTCLSRLAETTRTALDLIRQEAPGTKAFRAVAQLTVFPWKYKSAARLVRLMSCFKLLVVEEFFMAAFGTSVFTELARNQGFT